MRLHCKFASPAAARMAITITCEGGVRAPFADLRR